MNKTTQTCGFNYCTKNNCDSLRINLILLYTSDKI